jgi:Subtilase family/Fibronectin type-III domain/PA domain/Peptidase inhibitor I9
VYLVTHRAGSRPLAVIASLALAVSGASALTPASASPAAATHPAAGKIHVPAKYKPTPKLPAAGRYIVVLTDQPETAYDGNLTGYPATRPQAGKTFTAGPDAQRYRGYLESRQNQVLSAIGSPRKIYSYTTALNGFTANLTGAQVAKLRTIPGVLSVQRDKLVKLETTSSPAFLGLSGKHGVWAQHGGPAKAGKNIVIGDIDTGIWPENPSFAGKAKVPHVKGFNGICQVGERWKRTTCNSKIISARYFIKGFGVRNLAHTDFLSPRDGAGHGSHTASTAAGDHGVPVHIESQYFGKASGMAPAAHLAIYKACWEAKNPEDTGCYDSDTVDAINKAVQDGVDVINYSIGPPSPEDYTAPVELAFLGAAAGGVFVAASAGNSGPTPSTVNHPSPWLTTVAASTSHLFSGKVVLGNGKSYSGAMVSDQKVSMRRIILSTGAAKPGVKSGPASLCRLNTLDPAKVKNRIVVCDRGIIDRVTKSLAVKRAGGVGMVLVNTTPNSLDADFHSVPTVHLDDVKGAKVKRYVRNAGRSARAALDPHAKPYEPVPMIAPFSSRGPSLAGDGDILKPDLSAPGVSVVAAVAPPSNFGRRWDIYSGTSMAAPHISGLAAFIKHLRPSWTPAEIKSAMMTTATNLKGYHSPFAQGAGNINPRRFLDPGLVYNAGYPAWINMLQGKRTPSNVNEPSIAIGSLAGTEHVARMVTNVSGKRETYRASVQGVKGVNVKVSPAKITLGPGRVKKFTVNFKSTNAARFGKYSTGHLVWKGSRGHTVRSPIAIRPVAVSVPSEISVAPGSTTTTAGHKRIVGKAGFTGTLDLKVTGLAGATPQQGSVSQGQQIKVETVTIPAHTQVARFDLNATDDSDDLDLYVEYAGQVIAASATGSADEQITLTGLGGAAGLALDVFVDGFADHNGGGSPFAYTSWMVRNHDYGNLQTSPDPIQVNLGQRFHYRASWSGLDAQKRYFGYVSYLRNGARTGERTYVTVN